MRRARGSWEGVTSDLTTELRPPGDHQFSVMRLRGEEGKNTCYINDLSLLSVTEWVIKEKGICTITHLVSPEVLYQCYGMQLYTMCHSLLIWFEFGWTNLSLIHTGIKLGVVVMHHAWFCNCPVTCNTKFVHGGDPGNKITSGSSHTYKLVTDTF